MKIINLAELESNLLEIENSYKALKLSKDQERELRERKLRKYTYLSTYPEIINFTRNSKLDDAQYFKTLALMTYAWMPRVLRIDDKYLASAVVELSKAKNVKNNDFKEIDVNVIAECLHSLVGASKMLHFTNPEVFPIWDSKIQSVVGKNSNYYTMKKLNNYYLYIEQVHSLVNNKNFNFFYEKYNLANRKRLGKNNIQPYDVTPIRAIEASMFEMVLNVD